MISLMRCFFYSTEKQKEYSRIFYYRKNIWCMVMRLSIEDLLKETQIDVEFGAMANLKKLDDCDIWSEHFIHFSPDLFALYWRVFPDGV